jgi:hypothetical protein
MGLEKEQRETNLFSANKNLRVPSRGKVLPFTVSRETNPLVSEGT